MEVLGTLMIFGEGFSWLIDVYVQMFLRSLLVQLYIQIPLLE